MKIKTINEISYININMNLNSFTKWILKLFFKQKYLNTNNLKKNQKKKQSVVRKMMNHKYKSKIALKDKINL